MKSDYSARQVYEMLEYLEGFIQSKTDSKTEQLQWIVNLQHEIDELKNQVSCRLYD